MKLEVKSDEFRSKKSEVRSRKFKSGVRSRK